MTRAKFTITVPENCQHQGLSSAIRRARNEAGGETIVQALGAWFDAAGRRVDESVEERSYLATEANYSAVEAAVKDIARAMLDAGEQVVLVQHWVNGSFGFNLYTKENLQ